MITTKLAKKVLTKKEQTHLTKDAGIRSMAALKRQVEFMQEAEHPKFVCFECMRIARKLGLITTN